MLQKTVDTIVGWQKEGHETIAVICHDEIEASTVTKQLERNIVITDSNLETAEFERGVMVLPVEYTKGLEFDAVLIYHPSIDHYPAKDQYVKLLYVAATRALHELAVVHLGDLTELIAIPVSEEKRMQFLVSESIPKRGDFKKVDLDSEEKRQYLLEKYYQRTLINHASVLIEKQEQNQITSNSVSDKSNQDDSNATSLTEKQVNKEMDSNAVSLTEKQVNKEMDSNICVNKPVQKYKMETNTAVPINESPYQYNDVPISSMLYPKGHNRIDCSIRWVKRTKNCMDFVSSYGMLRLTPVGEAMIRVQALRGQAPDFAPGYWNYVPDKQVDWSARESNSQFEITSGQVVIRIHKKTGALEFLDKKGKQLLVEKSTLPRQMEVENNPSQTWNYFDWPRNEKLSTKGILDDDLERMDQKARYISFGGKNLRMPLLISEKGYGLGIAAENTVMCCNIPMYGPYIYTEGMNQIDYYFIYGGEYSKTLALYKEITSCVK